MLRHGFSTKGTKKRSTWGATHGSSRVYVVVLAPNAVELDGVAFVFFECFFVLVVS